MAHLDQSHGGLRPPEQGPSKQVHMTGGLGLLWRRERSKLKSSAPTSDPSFRSILGCSAWTSRAIGPGATHWNGCHHQNGYFWAQSAPGTERGLNPKHSFPGCSSSRWHQRDLAEPVRLPPVQIFAHFKYPRAALEPADWSNSTRFQRSCYHS